MPVVRGVHALTCRHRDPLPLHISWESWQWVLGRYVVLAVALYGNIKKPARKEAVNNALNTVAVVGRSGTLSLHEEKVYNLH